MSTEDNNEAKLADVKNDLDAIHAILDQGQQRAERFFAEIEAIKKTADQEVSTNSNYFMSADFDRHAAQAVSEAIAKADALGLPKAYGEAPVLPEHPVIVRVGDSLKKNTNQTDVMRGNHDH